jgi:hypothetical protein
MKNARVVASALITSALAVVASSAFHPASAAEDTRGKRGWYIGGGGGAAGAVERDGHLQRGNRGVAHGLLVVAQAGDEAAGHHAQVPRAGLGVQGRDDVANGGGRQGREVRLGVVHARLEGDPSACRC